MNLANNAGTWTIAARAVESTHCGLWMGGSGQFGLLTLRNSTGKDTVNLGNGENGDVYLRDKERAGGANIHNHLCSTNSALISLPAHR